MREKLLFGGFLTLLVLTVANLILLISLLQAKRNIGDALKKAAYSIETTAPSSSMPIVAHVAIDQTFSIPITMSVPIRTTVQVPVVIPVVGEVSVSVPINTSVPIDTTVRVPIQATIPIRIDANTLSFGSLFDQLRSVLESIAEHL